MATAKECGPRSTWTTGQITLDPGSYSIILGRAEVAFQFRDVSVPVLERMEACLKALERASNRRERCTATLTALSKAIPAPCDPNLMRALSEAAEQVCPGRWQVMPSGAGHDAQNTPRILPAAMLFVPSIGGISHHWAEDTSDADLAFDVCALRAAAAQVQTE